MNVRIHRATLAAIDTARGHASRDSWVEHACRLALRPTASFEDPHLHQPVHRHAPARLLRTELAPGGKRRIYACECGQEVSG